MSLFGFGNRHTEIVQLEELNFVSFEELLNTNNTFVEANNNKEDIFVEIVDDEDDEDFMFRSVNTTVLNQFASFEASMNVDTREVDDSNDSGVRGCIFNNPSYVCDYSKTTVALFGGDIAVEREKKHSLIFDASVTQGISKKARRDVSAGRTPMVPSCESFLSPTHFFLEGQSKDCVLSLMEDHLDNQEASFVYSEADSVWQVSVTDPDSPCDRQCEFIVSLYATVECARHVQSNYLLEALHLYGDADLFRLSFEGIRAIFQDVEEVEELLADDQHGLRQEDASYFSRTENRAALITHIDMPATDCDCDEDSILSVVLHQRRLQGAERICELSAIREMGPVLIDVGAVSALLTVFVHCLSDASAEVESLDNAIIPCAIGALTHLMHHKVAQTLMASHRGLLNYLRERVLMTSNKSAEDRLLRADMSTKARAMLVLLCRSHPDEVLSLLRVDSLQTIFSPTVATAPLRKTSESPLVSRGDKVHYRDSVSVDRFYVTGNKSRSGLSSTLSAIHI